MREMIEEITLWMIEYFGKEVKQINHTLKVYGFAKNIGFQEKISKEQLDILEISAILHDIGIKESIRKYQSSEAQYQEKEGATITKELLKKLGLKKGYSDRITYIVGNHHTYNQIDEVDFQILVEADFLVNIFEQGLGYEEVMAIRDKYFKTATGRKFIEKMFL